MPDFLTFINEILWGSVLIYLLLCAGIWFTLRSGFVQFRYIRYFPRALRKSFTPQPDGLTAFQALCTSLAARVGSGNIAGVALAISMGGPGAVFWMWVTALIGMATSFAECSLAQLYKGRDRNGQFRGGPAWYMERGLGMRWMGVLFSLFLLLSFGLVFNAVQASSVAFALDHAWQIPKWLTVSVLAALTLLVCTRGMRGIARMAQWLVPVMASLWVLTGLTIIALNIDKMPEVIETIFTGAFGWQEAASGVMGYTFSQALTSGFQRGMFSNEAGMGSTPNAAAAASSWPPHPAAQGIVQMIGVFVDTVIICSATAVIILIAGLPEKPLTPDESILLTQHALVSLTGHWASGYLGLIVLLFAFTSIVANYAYAENNLVFLRMDTPRNIWLLRLGVLAMIMMGAVINLTLVWHLADISMALMAITNLTAILLLSPVVKTLAADYLRQRKLGVKPHFDPARFPELQQHLAPDVWQNLPRE
ncbi:sodium:alanine symporter family protein [Atlantibacter subterranea]|uniref:Sodium:alanine symporter family protein n=1 Tax=Atlantibacter subterraneus TaxID=255519 RepID=A0ABU4E294_9ENTR|nr:sodium:alanine symporter family protein [Atlantibacter subterranea]MDV7023220.1 sodium:alanine symporter family protein [Atlantibacter subterranea]MDZ5666162.1 sodium:alanine symporter family protein [Atlantibacter hermannii]